MTTTAFHTGLFTNIARFLPRCMERSDENDANDAVCPSVRPSVTRVDCDKMVVRSVQIYTPYERTFSLVFWEEEWLVGATPSTWNFGSTAPRWSKMADFEPIIARSASAVTPSEKRSIDANSKSTTRFPMSLRWSSYVAPKSPKGGLKNEKRADLRKKLDFAWRKSATKFVCVKTVSGKVVKALIGSTNPAKMIGGGDPLYLKFWIIVTAFVRNRRFPLYFRS